MLKPITRLEEQTTKLMVELYPIIASVLKAMETRFLRREVTCQAENTKRIVIAQNIKIKD